MAGLSRDEGMLVREESQQQLPKKRSCVKRVLSGYNLFCQEKSSQPAFKALTAAERFRELSREWNALSQGEKDDIKARAKEAQGKVVNVKKQTKKSIDKMMSIIDHLQSIDSYDVLFVCVGGEGQKTYGGSDKGRQFVEENIHIVDDFRAFVDASNRYRMRNERPSVTVKDIRKIFNAKYAAAVGRPSAKMPYAAIEEKGITMDGMPGGLPLRRPGQYGSAQLRKIWDARNTLQCVIRA